MNNNIIHPEHLTFTALLDAYDTPELRVNVDTVTAGELGGVLSSYASQVDG